MRRLVAQGERLGLFPDFSNVRDVGGGLPQPLSIKPAARLENLSANKDVKPVQGMGDLTATFKIECTLQVDQNSERAVKITRLLFDVTRADGERCRVQQARELVVCRNKYIRSAFSVNGALPVSFSRIGH